MKRLALLSAGLLMAAPAAAQQPAPTDSSQVHVVRPGDTLWGISQQYLGDPFQWPRIFQQNRPPIHDPDLIYPAERLRIPGLLARNPAAPASAPPAAAAAAQAAVPEHTVFYGVQRVQSSGGIMAESEVQPRVVTAGDFYRAGRLVPESAVSAVGHLVQVVSPSVVPMQIQPQIQPYDKVFAQLSAAGVRVGDRYLLLRPDRRIGTLGRIYLSTGEASVSAVDAGVATVVVDRMFDRVMPGDLLVPLDRFAVATGAPRPASDLAGHLVALERPTPVATVQDLGFVDLGRSAGVQEGDEFAVVLPPEQESWGVRPEVVIARLQVVRVAEQTSTVRVTQLEQPALRAGLPVRRVARMP
ncbi:MAG TPA: LysM peptidoglycan-binding domain-containing protein [Longimicrobiaceae bacterium]|nr:LysM peptidoglycan-binding domain-containing protein [Longimicrobiaceae bacterium]